jgi:hypothetical protein
MPTTDTRCPVTGSEHQRRQNTGRPPKAPAVKRGEPEIRLLLAFTPQRDPDTLEVSAQPVRIVRDEGNVERVRNLPFGGYDTHPLSDLMIHALASRDAKLGDSHFWTTEYRDCFAVNLRRAAQMHKTLKTLGRAAQRIHDELGAPETFAAYLARTALALRVTSFGFHLGGESGSYDANTYQWTDAAGMVHRVGDHISRWRSATP